MPSWIHTTDAAAWTGWLPQTVTPTLTRCWTHPGDPLAAGRSTLVGMPRTIPVWACSKPSAIQIRPKPIRRMRRPRGSGAAPGCGAGGRGVRPAAMARRYCMVRTRFHATAAATTTRATTSNWCSSAEWNAETIVGLSLCSERVIPGIGSDRPGHDAVQRHRARH
jgi:hypothetical protein